MSVARQPGGGEGAWEPWCDRPGQPGCPGWIRACRRMDRTRFLERVESRVRRLTVVLATVLLILTGAVTGPGSPASADGAPPKRISSGWLPYWMTSPGRPQGVNSAVQNADLFTDVSPFWYSATSKPGGGVQVRINPNFTNGAANISWAMGQLKAAGLTVLPAIADGSGKGRMAATLADPTLRAAHIADIVSLVVSNGFDGIDLDYEGFAFTDGSSTWAATQPNWTAFVTELAAALHAQGKLLSVTVPPPCNTAGTCGNRLGYWVYDIAGIGAVADRVRIMAYDFSVSRAGPIAPMPWVRSIVGYSASIMDPARLQIGVPTYGRAWTRRTASGAYRLSGVCPTDTSSAAYRSLTSTASLTDADIPGQLAAVGVGPQDVQWSDEYQENWVRYGKTVTWTDSSGASQTCTAQREMWWVGPQAVLARTQLVGEFGLSAAAYWTIGGEDPTQWPLIRAYGQSLAPATTDVSVTPVASAVFGTPVTIAATALSSGTAVTGVNASLQFRRRGTSDFVEVQNLPVNPDGTVLFSVSPPWTGAWRVYIPAVAGRVEGVSSTFTLKVLSAVTAEPKATTVPVGSRLVVRATALPAVAGQSVALQIQRGDRWKNVATTTVNGKGRARLVAEAPSTRGRYVYRIVAVGRAGILANASPEFRIRVTR